MHHQNSSRKSSISRQSPAPTSASKPADTSTPSMALASQLRQEDILMLQRQIGNAGTIRLLHKNGVMPKPSGAVQRLPQNLSGTMQTMFGDSAKQVEVRTGAEANHIARQANADATSVGNVIYFRDGAYQPDTVDGNALITQQMTHIAQRQISRTLTPSDKADAHFLGNVVRDLGPQPDKQLQRKKGRLAKGWDQLDGGRVAGIVVSKALQGIGNMLGPVGLVWRLPQIRKNIREYTNTTGKPNDFDQNRYGNGTMADVARFIASYAEILKEATIWLGLATFIAAIVAGATHGAAAPAFAILAIMTATVGGFAALLKLYLIGHNLVRLAFSKAGSDENAAIRHQLFIDGMDFIGNAVSAVTSSLGAAGAVIKLDGGVPDFSGSAGGAFAKGVGVGGSGGVALGKVMGDTLFSPLQGAIPTGIKEGGKDLTKPNTKKEESGFKGGFLKDFNVITGHDHGYGKKPPTPPQQSSTPPSSSPVGDQSSVDDVGQKLTVIKQMSATNLSIEQGMKVDSDNYDKTLKKELGDVPKVVKEKDTQLGGELQKTKEGVQQAESLVESNNIEPKDENEIRKTQKDVNEGLKKVDEEQIVDDPQEQKDNTDTVVGRKGGVFGNIKAWFAKKLSKVKAGLRRLNRKVMQGVFKLISKFTKGGGDLKNASSIIATALPVVEQQKQTEGQNVELAQQFDEQAGVALESFNQAKQEEVEQ